MPRGSTSSQLVSEEKPESLFSAELLLLHRKTDANLGGQPAKNPMAASKVGLPQYAAKFRT